MEFWNEAGVDTSRDSRLVQSSLLDCVCNSDIFEFHESFNVDHFQDFYLTSARESIPWVVLPSALSMVLPIEFEVIVTNRTIKATASKKQFESTIMALLCITMGY